MVLAHQDAWRKHPFISNCAKKPFTGLGTAAAIFSVYCVVDAIAGASGGSHGHGHDSHAHGHGDAKVAYERAEVGERPTLSQ